MYVRRVTIERFRGIEHLQFCPRACTVILGPNNGGKSTVLEALDLLLHSGLGRPRPAPEESDYFRRDSAAGFEVEAVLGALSDQLLAELHHYLEGWRDATHELIAEPDGEGVEPVVRVRLTGTAEYEHLHEFAKPEAEGARFYPESDSTSVGFSMVAGAIRLVSCSSTKAGCWNVYLRTPILTQPFRRFGRRSVAGPIR